jgi:hypothetical protein
MKAFKNLKIIDPDSDRLNLIAFLEMIRSTRVSNWGFLEKESADYAMNLYKDYKEVAVFASPIICNRTARVWLVLSGREIKITNIVPTETGSLKYEEYNSILDNFNNQVVLPAARQVGVDVITTPAYVDMENIVGRETYEKLLFWEITANSNSGNEHDLDFERWASFLTSAFTYKSKITAQLLERWLLEDKGWIDGELVQRLGSEFEYGIDLLNYYVNNR